MKATAANSATLTAGKGTMGPELRITQLEAENRKLRQIIAQMVCVAEAVDDLPARHKPVHPQQGGPVHVIDGGVLGNGSGQIGGLGSDVAQQVG
jgi:hypothetical protein